MRGRFAKRPEQSCGSDDEIDRETGLRPAGPRLRK